MSFVLVGLPAPARVMSTLCRLARLLTLRTVMRSTVLTPLTSFSVTVSVTISMSSELSGGRVPSEGRESSMPGGASTSVMSSLCAAATASLSSSLSPASSSRKFDSFSTAISLMTLGTVCSQLLMIPARLDTFRTSAFASAAAVSTSARIASSSAMVPWASNSRRSASARALLASESSPLSVSSMSVSTAFSLSRSSISRSLFSTTSLRLSIASSIFLR
mmetsp:Transcript_48723/g.156007  ORF Transcript_48723/g.156007 Transcript_48723/m.156007 type:complete len:219 (-) Transcript_48723:2844-3500(-)